MNIQYSIDKKDHLNYQLYIASTSSRIKKKRQRSRFGVPIAYAIIALVFVYLKNNTLASSFLAFGLVWIVVYPLWEKQRYQKHYTDFINEHYKNNVGKTFTLELNKEYIFSKESENESKINTKEISEIVEISSTFFILLSGGQALILPKDKIDATESLAKTLRDLAVQLNINYTHNEKWEWK